MGSIGRRLKSLEAIEGKIRPRASPAGNRSPEEVAERERQFRQLYSQLGVEAPPEPKRREDAFEELFAAIESHRQALVREEANPWA